MYIICKWGEATQKKFLAPDEVKHAHWDQGFFFPFLLGRVGYSSFVVPMTFSLCSHQVLNWFYSSNLYNQPQRKRYYNISLFQDCPKLDNFFGDRPIKDAHHAKEKKRTN
jgi:hypothetical protein